MRSGASTAAAIAGALAFGGAASAADLDSMLRPVPLATFAADVHDCVGATQAASVVEPALLKAGWSRGTVSAKTELRFFSKDGMLLILSPAPTPGRSSCLEMARFAEPVAGKDLIGALSATFRKQPFRGPDGQQFWMLDGEVAGVNGNDAKAPTQVRVVIAPNEGKKTQ